MAARTPALLLHPRGARTVPTADSEPPAILEAPHTEVPLLAGGEPPLALPIEALLRLPGHHRVVCEPEPQRWRVYQDGRFVGYLTRTTPPVQIELTRGRTAGRNARGGPGPTAPRGGRGRA